MERACLESLNADSEFKKIEMLPNEHLTIETIDPLSEPLRLRQIISHNASDMAATAAELLSKNDLQSDKSFKMVSIIASQLSTTNLTYYFRSGRSYIGISHNMGPLGNMFFKAAFDDLFGSGKYHLIEHENRLCLICRA